jgi:hypothetical protein
MDQRIYGQVALNHAGNDSAAVDDKIPTEERWNLIRYAQNLPQDSEKIGNIK